MKGWYFVGITHISQKSLGHMGIRLLLLIFLAWLIWWLFKPLFQNRGKLEPKAAKEIEDMVRCTHCQVNLPKQEALELDGHYFCNTEHRQQYEEGQK